MRLRLIFRGSWRVYGICDGDVCRVLGFLDAGAGNDHIAKDKRKMLAYFERVAHTILPPRDSEITHLVDTSHRIWQTTQGQARALWFYDADRIIVLSHGFLKKSQKTPDGELEQARNARREYLKAKQTEDLWSQEDC